MVIAKKTGSPPEIAQTLRDVADKLENLPASLVIRVEITTEVLEVSKDAQRT